MQHISGILPDPLSRADLPLSAFRDFLALATKIADKRGNIPVLTHARVISSGDRLFATVTDLDMEFTEALTAWNASKLRLTFPVHKMHDLARKAKKPTAIELHNPIPPELEGGPNLARFVIGPARVRLESLPITDFPSVDRESLKSADARHFSMEGESLRGAFESVKFAISTEETRYYLNGIFMHFMDSGEIAFVATDGHRLARKVVPGGPSGFPANGNSMAGVIVPRATVLFLLKAWAGKACPEDVRISVSPSKIRFTWGNRVLISKLIDGTFPDYARVIPTSPDKFAQVDTASLVESISTVSQIRDERDGAIRLEFGQSSATLTCRSTDGGGDCSTEYPLTVYRGDPLEIGFNSAYLAECLAVMQGSDKGGIYAVLELRDAGTPVRIVSLARPGFDVVLMPMRV